MRFALLTVALAAGVASALSTEDIPSDTPVSALLASAQGHLSRGETSEALVYYDAAVGRDPNDYLTYFKRATTYLSLGRASQATDDFTKVLALRPGFEAAHLQLGKIRQRVADWDGAREQLRQVKGSATEAAEMLASIDEAENAAKAAEAAHGSQNWEECANQASVALMVASRAASLRKIRAVCRFARGEVEEGVGDLQHVLNIRPGDITPHLIISAINFYSLGDFNKGTAQVRKCLQSDPDSKPCMKLLKKEKAAQKTFAKVEKAFSKNQPSTGTIHLIPSGENPGLIQEIKDQVASLVADGILPAAAPNGLVSKLTSMACQGYYEMGNSKKGKTWCEQALQLDENSLFGLLQKAKQQLDDELYDASIETLKKAKEAHPDKQDTINEKLKEAEVLLRRSKEKDYYKVIGVSRDADGRQIKQAYRKLSKIHHPDKAAKQGLTKEAAEKKMAEINEAYEVLSDPELRARFDRGDDPNQQGGGGGGGGHHQGFHGHPFMYQQNGGQQFKFQFGSGGGGPGGFPFRR